MEKRIVLTAAPGGHSGYAAAIAYYLRETGIQPVFLVARGDKWTISRLRSLGVGGEIHEVVLPRKPGEALARSLPRWPTAFRESVRLLRMLYKRGARVLVSCGSNLSLAPATVAKLLGMKLFNVESIVRMTGPGKTPKLLDPLSEATLVHWPEQARFFRNPRVVGPIYMPPRYKSRDEGYILVTTGTMGHPRLFEALSKLDLRDVVLQTGRVDPEPYRRRHPSWRVFQFTPDLDRWIAGAHIVITHFPGSTSATAALAYNKPVILVAAPHLRGSAPQDDALLYAEKIGAIYVREVSPKRLAEAIREAERSIEPGKAKSYPVGAREAAKLLAGIAYSNQGGSR